MPASRRQSHSRIQGLCLLLLYQWSREDWRWKASSGRGQGQVFIPGVRLAGTRAIPDRRAGASLQGLAHFKHPAAAERHRLPVYCTCLPYTASVACSGWCLAPLRRWNATLHLLLASPEKQMSPRYSQNLLLITSQLTEEGFAQV